MKTIAIIISIFLVILFALSINNSIKYFNKSHFVTSINDANIKGFDSELLQNTGFNELEKKISTLIIKEKSKTNALSNWGIILNLIITIVTGLSALITTISTIKNNSVTKSIAITVAIITFTSSLLSYSLSQVNSFKEESLGRQKKIIQIREQLESLKPNEVDGQLPILNRKLDEEL